MKTGERENKKARRAERGIEASTMNRSEADVFERREFLKRSALMAAGVVLAGKFAKWSEIDASAAEERSKVVVVTSDAVIREGQGANAAVVEKMLE